MPGAAIDKFRLWRQEGTGLKSRFDSELLAPAIDRDDISSLIVNNKIDRGDQLQELRLRYYPSINVDRAKLFAGMIPGDLQDAEDALLEMGFRNNPTAYVEVTEQHGPDDGSYARVEVTETGARFNIPQFAIHPSLYKRMKRQLHATIYEVDNGVIFLLHDERAAWLQPMRHVFINDVSARVGVRDFRDLWYDTFQQELSGKNQVAWDTTH